MSTTMAQTTAQQPRPSTETDRRHLLSPSEASSVYQQTEGEQTPRASSPAPRRETLATISKPYRGFPSEAAYLAAFHEWAESKKYLQQDTTLIGFYGETTMEEIASRPRQEFGISKRIKAHKAKKEARRASAAV